MTKARDLADIATNAQDIQNLPTEDLMDTK